MNLKLSSSREEMTSCAWKWSVILSLRCHRILQWSAKGATKLIDILAEHLVFEDSNQIHPEIIEMKISEYSGNERHENGKNLRYSIMCARIFNLHLFEAEVCQSLVCLCFKSWCNTVIYLGWLITSGYKRLQLQLSVHSTFNSI